MALKKIVEVEGESFIQSEFLTVKTGLKKTTFLAMCKVISVQGSKNSLEFSVSFGGDEAGYVKKYKFEPSVADGSSNFIKQAYLYLKTLPEFAGAEDC
jgi:hypothetical protein